MNLAIAFYLYSVYAEYIMNEIKLYKTQKQKLKTLSKNEFQALKVLTHVSKNLYNVTLYSIRQYYFQEQKFLRYESNYHYCKENENYKLLGTDISQQIMRVVDRNFRSFFNASKEYSKAPTKFTGKPKLPKYLDKESHFALIIPSRNFSKESFNIPTSRGFKKQYGEINIKFPSNIKPETIAEIRIHPKLNAKYFEIEYIYEVEEIEKPKLDSIKTLAIDLGINNLVSCITSTGDAFLISGKPIKSINQWYNKERARLSSIKDKQGYKHETKKLFIITQKRNRQVNHFMNVTVKRIIDFCLTNSIGNIVIGYNNFWKQDSNMGKKNNQKFVQIPHATLRNKLETKCNEYGINFIQQEESYTSKASFIDNDNIPIYKANDNSKYQFSGSRIKRGLYRTKDGLLVNSDINGASNILKKSKQVFNYELLRRGCLTHPLSIKIA